MQNFNKMIGIGLPKTGTVSLSVALTNNNVPTVHFGSSECDEVRQKMYRGIYKFDVLEKYEGLVNGFEVIFPQVDKEYPNSKFIYTTRSKDGWMNAVEEHWEGMMGNAASKPMEVYHHLITFGTFLFNKDRFSFVYDMHTSMVEHYFKDRQDDVLTIDITKDKDFVSKSCAFLGVPLLDSTPLHLNKKSFN